MRFTLPSRLGASAKQLVGLPPIPYYVAPMFSERRGQPFVIGRFVEDFYANLAEVFSTRLGDTLVDGLLRKDTIYR